MTEKKKKPPAEDPLSSHLFERAVCANCGKSISEERLEKAKQTGWMPLCESCDEFMKEQLEKCRPLMEQLMGG